MKSYTKELWFEVPTRRAFINITAQVEQCLRESGIQEGLLLCNAMHITASIFINDDESGLHYDYEQWLERLAPHEPVSQYRHNGYEDNADAHMKRQIMGREVVVAVTRRKTGTTIVTKPRLVVKVVSRNLQTLKSISVNSTTCNA